MSDLNNKTISQSSSRDHYILIGAWTPYDLPNPSTVSNISEQLGLRLAKYATTVVANTTTMTSSITDINILPIRSPSWIVISPNGKYIYVTNEHGEHPGSITSLEISYHDDIDDTSHSIIESPSSPPKPLLSITSTCNTSGYHPCHITISPCCQYLVVSNYGVNKGTSSLDIFQLDHNNGKIISCIQSFPYHTGSSVISQRQESGHAHCAMFVPLSNTTTTTPMTLYCCDLGSDTVKCYIWDHMASPLSPCRPYPDGNITLPPGSGPRHIIFTPDASLMLICTELSSCIHIYSRQNYHSTDGPVLYSEITSTSGYIIHDDTIHDSNSSTSHATLTNCISSLPPLSLVDTSITWPDGADLTGGSSIDIIPQLSDSSSSSSPLSIRTYHLYAATRGTVNQIGHWIISYNYNQLLSSTSSSPSTEQPIPCISIKLIGYTSTHSTGPRTATLTPDGSNIIIANVEGGKITSICRDTITGTLSSPIQSSVSDTNATDAAVLYNTPSPTHVVFLPRL